MASIWDLFVSLGIDTRDFQEGIANAREETEAARDSFRVAGLSLTDLKSGFDMALGAVGPVVQALKQTIDAASDMNETVSKSQVVFGEMAGAVEAMGNSAAKAMGMSKNEAIGAAATYGNLFVSMGIGSKASADMSMSLVKLAGDFASFNNIPVAEALDKIRAGLVGESEPLKSLGVNLNEATLKAEAMALGLSDGKGVLDSAAKAQAAYSIMLKQSTTAQGDFARTAEGAANQQKILEAQTKDLTASIGKGLLPAYIELLKVGNSIISNFGIMITAQTDLDNIVKLHSKNVALEADTYARYRSEMKRATEAAGMHISATGEVTRTVIEANGAVREINIGLNLSAGYYSKISDEGTRAANAAKLFGSSNSVLVGTINAVSGELLNQESAFKASAAASKAYSETYQILNDAALKTINESMKPLTLEMLYQKAAAGLDSSSALELARAMGLVNEKTYSTLKQVEALRQKFLETGEIEEYKRALLDMAYQDYLVTIRADFSQLERALSMAAQLNAIGTANITGPTFSWTPTTTPTTTQTTTPGPDFSGTPGAGPIIDNKLANGGSYIVPSGFNENYPVGGGAVASSGERVTVTPAGKAGNNMTISLNFYGPTNAEQAKQGVLAGMRAAGKA